MKNKNIFKLIIGIALIGIISLAGCQKMEIVKIVGFIQGHVFDGNTNQTLDNVSVEWLIAGEKDSTTATADDGYLVANLPVGSYSLWFKKDGYTTVVSEVAVEDNNTSSVAVRGGESIEQIITLDANMYPLNGAIKGRIYKDDNGVEIPVQGVVVMLDYNSSYAEEDEHYRFVPNIYTDSTDADGYFNFTNVPATRARFIVKPYTDENGKEYIGSYQAGTWTTYYNSWDVTLDNGVTTLLGNIIMKEQTDDIHLINTNVWTSPNNPTNNFPVAENITLSYNQNVDEAITNERGKVNLMIDNGSGTWINVETEVSFENNTITINPVDDLRPNTTYRLDVTAYSDIYNSDNNIIDFKTVDNTTIPAQVSGFDLYYDNFIADYSSNPIAFKWELMDNVEKYEIYAKDTYKNTDFVKISTLSPSDYLQGTTGYYISLPASFDYYEDDGVQTPFSHGTEVSYKIRAVNSAGAGAFSDVITIKDETPFDHFDMDIDDFQDDGDGNSVSANNTTGTTTLTITMTFDIFSGRYADVSVTPEVRLWDGTTEITPTHSVTWTDHQHGVITFEVPAGENYSNMDLRLYNITDSSGNTMEPDEYEREDLY